MSVFQVALLLPEFVTLKRFVHLFHHQFLLSIYYTLSVELERLENIYKGHESGEF